MSPDDLAKLVRDSLEEEDADFVERDEVIRNLPEPARFNLVHIITGMRRCGKTFYLFQLMAHLRKAGVPRRDMLYFNFSDDRLKPSPEHIMDMVVEEYWRQVPEARRDGCYLFLDEVQDAGDWQGFCQRVAEKEKTTLVITGSSSKVSSGEIATSFRGRSHVHEMWPLSFREYCRFHDIGLPEPGQDAFSQASVTRYEGAYDRYLLAGGFPGVQRLSEEDRIEVLQGYVRDVVARDVADRSGRGDVSLAMQLALFAVRNTACEISTNELASRLAALGYKTYWEKVDGLLGLLRQSYLIHYLKEYTTSLKPSTSATPKVYAEDPGLAHAVSLASQQDLGKRLETAVFLELRRRLAGRRTDTVTSLTIPAPRRQKVDFLVGDALGAEPYALYQVSASLSSPKTREREVGSLEAGMEFARRDEGTIVTLREQETVRSPAGRIEVVPAWRWSLLG